MKQPTRLSHADNIELRSEKVRALIGEIPSSLVRWSVIVMLLIVIALLSVVIFVNYPYGHGESILRHVTGL